MSDPPPPTGPPPGWYTDPTTGQGYRWWDGFGWSEQTTDRLDDTASALRPVSDWMSETFRAAAGRSGHFFAMIVVLMVPAGLLNGMALWAGLRDAVLITNADTGEFSFTSGAGGGTYGLIIASLVLVVIAWVALTTAAVQQADAALSEAPEPWSESMAGALRRLPRALGVALAIGVILLVGYLVLVFSAAISPILLLVTFPGWIAVSVLAYTRLSLAPVGAALAPSGVRALNTSWELTRSYFWAIFGRLLLLLLVGLAFSLIAGLISTPFTAIAGGGSEGAFEPGSEELRFADILGDNPAIFAIGQLFSAIGNGASTVIWAVGLTLLYRDLSGPKVARPAVDVDVDVDGS